MVKIAVLISIIFLINSCGGGSVKIDDDLSPKDILTKNNWYEICEDINNSKISKEYIFDDKSFYIKEYNNSNFKTLKKIKEYNIKYKTGLIELNNTRHQFECVINRGGVDNTINWILIDCTGVNKNEIASYPGYRTKELAQKNIDECFENSDN